MVPRALAQFDQAQGQVNLNQAQLKLAKSNYQRDLSLAPNNVSPQQLDYDRAKLISESQS